MRDFNRSLKMSAKYGCFEGTLAVAASFPATFLNGVSCLSASFLVGVRGDFPDALYIFLDYGLFSFCGFW